MALSTLQGMRLAPVPDAALRPGQCLWVAGPSGAGKSTLLAALSGLWPFGEAAFPCLMGRALLPQAPRVFPRALPMPPAIRWSRRRWAARPSRRH
ncbi:ATP-binding cassette domain-containing protein [Pannonibacter sp. Pt2-lr]